MFQNKLVSITLRIICLITFVVVILLTNSFITLSLLTIAFYLFTRNDSVSFVFVWHIATIIIFLICCLIDSFVLLKIVLIVGLAIYFLVTPYGEIIEEIVISKKKSIPINKYFIRFKSINIKRKEIIDKNLINTIYVTVHLFILFIIIMVG